MKLVLPVLVLALHQVSADWSGSGELRCYGHYSTDVTTPEGGGYLQEGKVDCNIVEWDGVTRPEAMFFHPYSGADFEIWSMDYHNTQWGPWPIPTAHCEGDIWYKKDDMDAGYCTPHKGYSGCGFASCKGAITCSGC